jgi:hypothetical protein
VNNGGSVYASDWAYDVVEIGWPDRVDFVGADEIPNDAQLGEHLPAITEYRRRYGVSR